MDARPDGWQGRYATLMEFLKQSKLNISEYIEYYKLHMNF
jgi:hypothetical protein